MLKRDLYYERISTKSLRDDVRYLGNILGKVIKDQEGKKFFDLVEKTRLLSKANIANRRQKNPFNKLNLFKSKEKNNLPNIAEQRELEIRKEKIEKEKEFRAYVSAINQRYDKMTNKKRKNFFRNAA